MIQQVRKTVKYFKMFEPSEKVVVAVSGGPDSIALLHVLKRLNIELCLNIYVAHLDHNIRRGSAGDCAFVKRYAQLLGLPFYKGIIPKSRIKRATSLEEYLRRCRYDFLLKVCKKVRAKKIALGHTQDDQAETVLMRILRGSGLYGLCAILPKRALGSYEIVRPFIEVSRDQVMDYLKKNKIAFRIDKTNYENDFMRNKIRNHLLPLLEEQYNPSIKKALWSLALTVGADYNYLSLQLEPFLRKDLKKVRRGYSLNLASLKKLDLSLRRLAIRRAIEMLKGDLRRISFKHWQEAQDLIYARPLRSEVHLPNDITLSKSKSCLNIFKR